MPFYHTLGRIPKKRHIAFRKPDGGLYAEQLVGHEGFTGTSALLYHVHPPTTVKSVKRIKETKLSGADVSFFSQSRSTWGHTVTGPTNLSLGG